jgi:hypothetical protein
MVRPTTLLAEISDAFTSAFAVECLVDRGLINA